jgi:hypothetical protein
VLNDIQIEYEIEIELFNKLSKTIKYDHTKKKRDILQFIEELPHKLKLELAMVIHLKMYSTVDYFKGKDKSFIAWIVTLIRPLNCESQDYIYKEGEEVFESKNILFNKNGLNIVYFLVKGTAALVLPRLENRPYKEIIQG